MKTKNLDYITIKLSIYVQNVYLFIKFNLFQLSEALKLLAAIRNVTFVTVGVQGFALSTASILWITHTRSTTYLWTHSASQLHLAIRVFVSNPRNSP